MGVSTAHLPDIAYHRTTVEMNKHCKPGGDQTNYGLRPQTNTLLCIQDEMAIAAGITFITLWS